MKGIGTIALREIVERRILLLLALAVGVIPIVLPLLPFVRSAGGYAEVRDTTAYSLAVAFSFGLAVLLGASLFVRDLIEGRLGFYFSRPMSGLSLWAGRFAGAFFLVLGTGIVVLLPSTLLGGGLLALPVPQIGPNYEFGFPWMDLLGPVFGTAGTLLFFLFLSHAAAVVFRSRSAWAALDFMMLLACAVSALLLLRFLLVEGAYFEVVRETGAFALFLLVALAAAGAVQVCIGRTDLKRGHRVLSMTLWGCMIACFALLGLRAAWYTSFSPADLTDRTIIASPTGPWVQLSGRARNEEYRMQRAFLFNTDKGGAPVKLKGCAFYSEVAFSDEGARAAWYSLGGWMKPGLSIAGFPGRLSFEIMLTDLNGPTPVTRPSGVIVSMFPLILVLSPDGRRLAYLDGGSLSVIDTDSFKGIASMKLPDLGERPWNLKLRFLSADLVRIYLVRPSDKGEKEQAELGIYEWNLVSRKLEQTGTTGPFGRPLIVQTDPGCEKLLLRAKRDLSWVCLLCDGRTGQPLGDLPTREDSPLTSATFLSDGRIGMTVREAGRLTLKIYSQDGEEQRALPITDGWKASIAGQPSAGQVLLSVLQKQPAAGEDRWDKPREVWLADLGTGQTKRLAIELWPVSITAYWSSSDPAARALMSGPSTLLFMKGEALVKLDPATGSTSVILAPGPKAAKAAS